MEYESRLANLLGAVVVGGHDRLAEATQAAAGRSGVTAAALATLAQYPGLTVEQLRRCLGISQPATVRTVDALQDRGLLRREPGADRRSLALRLTESGLRSASEILTARAEVLAPLLAGIDPAGRAALTAALELVLDRLTVDIGRGDEICRLCDIAACPQDRCPVEGAQRRASTHHQEAHHA